MYQSKGTVLSNALAAPELRSGATTWAKTPFLAASFIEEKIKFALSRYGQRIRVIEISLKDINGPRGGVDKQCVIKMKINQFKTLVVDDISADGYEAITACTQKAKRRIERHFGRSRSQQRRPTVA